MIKRQRWTSSCSSVYIPNDTSSKMKISLILVQPGTPNIFCRVVYLDNTTSGRSEIFYACQVFVGMTKRIIFRPIEFINSLKKKRTEIPKCLYDPSLGTHGFILLEEVKLHYVANGKEGKPLMLLLHGYPEFWYSWKYQLKEFSKDYRVVAIDMRGFGESDKPSGVSNYKIETVANDVKQLIPALGYSQCTLVGHDMGALVAWMFVTEHPQMVKEMIIMNVPYPTAAAKYMRTIVLNFMDLLRKKKGNAKEDKSPQKISTGN
ncbi:hypothetical protein KUTeg_017577 [Tegillarca granosa]|uniref:AB hydrolase-1 domain-containing protein n=1 Tax=Tegillarca granosa TaxID=220873 RepID=A0ABQ9EFB1_TEGGR|nr:hypothetical protein KUTeg_017577 [Tegillarca granosa]